MRELVETIAKALVDAPDQVKVTEQVSDKGTLITLSVAKEDIGKVIGKQGRVANAIRSVVKAATPKDGTHVFVEIQRPLEELAEDETPEADEEEDSEV